MGPLTIKKDSVVEFTEKKSVFIGHAFFVTNEEEALACLEKVRRKDPQATHHVFAYSLRKNGIQRFSDAGEPQGTAGMPVLKVITLNNITDVCIVVTRYFGGILLGAGGLVRAYTKAAAMAVEAAEKTEIITATTFMLEYSYDMHDNIVRILESHGAEIKDKTFTDKVTLTAVLPEDDYKNLKEELKTLYYTKLEIEEIESVLTRRK